MKTKLSLICGDITKLSVDAIVNSANSSLLGGGGVDSAIHAAAGPELLEECRELHGCTLGDAKLTRGYALPARFVIHTVGPIYGHEDGREKELLTSCYVNCLELAVQQGEIKTLAFPAISAGVFRYPTQDVASVAIRTVKKWVAEHEGVFDEVMFVVYGPMDMWVWEEEMSAA
jgi:O-acetyl-ADP-ribose deacetylase (regulator of RNase III)